MVIDIQNTDQINKNLYSLKAWRRINISRNM